MQDSGWISDDASSVAKNIRLHYVLRQDESQPGQAGIED